MNVNQTTGQEGDGMSLGTVRDLLAGMSWDEIKEIGSGYELFCTCKSSYDYDVDTIEECDDALREAQEAAVSFRCTTEILPA